MKDLVSIVIPCFKHAALLPRAIESALNQRLVNTEIIVVDDGSPDETAEIAISYAGQGVKLVSQENAGLSAARNAGMACAKGDWVLFLDADDEIDNDYLTSMLSQAREETDALFGSFRCVSPQGVVRYEQRAQSITGDTLHSVLQGGLTVVHAVVLRTTAARRYGQFNTNLRSREDFEYWVRMARAGARFQAVPEGWVSYHDVEGSMSRNNEQMGRATLLVLENDALFHVNCNECNRIRRRLRLAAQQRVAEGSEGRVTARRIIQLVRGGELNIAVTPLIQFCRRIKALTRKAH